MTNGHWDGIFLDLYGTLTAGDRAAVGAVCSRVVSDLGLSLSADRFAVEWGERFFKLVDESNHDRFRTLFDCETASLRETVAAHGRTIDPVPYVSPLEAYWSNPPMHPEVREALATVPVPVCIVSNADHAHALAALERSGLQFEHVITSEQARCYKPDAAIFRYALRQTGWRPERVMHVGDSLHSDIRGARNAGLVAGWLCRENRIHDIGTVEPHHTFRDLRELAAMLNGR